ncbi:hypothetical protein [Metabacillus iocasae]|uniref:Uncharacterized protein n=1 Tax=Priestia iocasae TaxID=2291674 RepID=A0ABS2QV24_9BACI|nr:hypothetical protein [Metabacillus iocasae]MBM7702571.1 hypothetical protein [Metabacillus iocasae]
MIMYLNLLSAGYTYKDYLMFVWTRPECYLFIIGLAVSSVCIYYPNEMRKNNER